MTFGPRQKVRGRDDKEAAQPKQITPVAPGSYGSAAILLLSDGRRTTGVDTLEAAKMAADRGVRIHVVGLGTVDGVAGDSGGLAIYMVDGALGKPPAHRQAGLAGADDDGSRAHRRGVSGRETRYATSTVTLVGLVMMS